MKKPLGTILGLALCSSVPAVARAQVVAVTLTSSNTSVQVDSFGRAGSFYMGTGFRSGPAQPVQMYEHTDFFSTGGAVQAIEPNALGGCAVTMPILADTPDHATSQVNCGDCTFDFDQSVDGVAGTWTTLVTASGASCTIACYYSYTDYDIYGSNNNGGSWHATNPTPRFVVRNEMTSPTVHYLFSDLSGSDHWQQADYGAGLRGAIGTAMTCPTLTDTPLTAAPIDWTGALQFSTQTVSYSHGRDDTVSYP